MTVWAVGASEKVSTRNVRTSPGVIAWRQEIPPLVYLPSLLGMELGSSFNCILLILPSLSFLKMIRAILQDH